MIDRLAIISRSGCSWPNRTSRTQQGHSQPHHRAIDNNPGRWSFPFIFGVDVVVDEVDDPAAPKRKNLLAILIHALLPQISFCPFHLQGWVGARNPSASPAQYKTAYGLPYPHPSPLADFEPRTVGDTTLHVQCSIFNPELNSVVAVVVSDTRFGVKHVVCCFFIPAHQPPLTIYLVHTTPVFYSGEYIL